ncbi:MAG: hypothetical protein ACRCZF_14105, partial [Gemmataceae bacterium]
MHIPLSRPNATALSVRLTNLGKARELLVTATIRGQSVGQQRIPLTGGQTADVPLELQKSLGSVVRVTVYEVPTQAIGDSIDYRPLAERLVYRASSSQLKLSYTTDKPDYLPGDMVEMKIQAKTEANQPTGAILWAGVTNQSLASMANDRRERSLPAHFAIATEVQKPDDLEYADIFLSGQPSAVRALDELLGTQGWRRFVEQTGQFATSTLAEDQSRFQILHGLQPSTIRSAAENRALAPQAFTSTERAYAAAIENLRTTYDEAEWNKLQDEQLQRRSDLFRDCGEVSAKLDRLRTYQGNLPYYAAGCFTFAVLVAILARFRKGVAGPAWFIVAVAFLAGGGSLFLGQLPVNPVEWQSRHGQANVGVVPKLPMPTPSVSDNPPTGALAVAAGGFDPRENGNNTAIGRNNPLIVDDLFAKPKLHETASAVAQALSPQTQSQLARLGPQFQSALKRALPPSEPMTPQLRSAIQKVEAKLARKPFIAREYAHAGPATANPNPVVPDRTETVLWHPVLVVPSMGAATVRFRLSDNPEGYRVVIAGHTLDGRLGHTESVLESRKALRAGIRLPAEVTLGDSVGIPFFNNERPHTSALVYQFDTQGEVLQGAASEMKVSTPRPGFGSAWTGQWTPTQVRPSHRFGVTISDPITGETDTRYAFTRVVPRGFPQTAVEHQTWSAPSSLEVKLPPERLRGSTQLTLSFYPNFLATLVAGLDGLLAEPHGCFEQASAANYPNILILQLLQKLGMDSPRAGQARALLEKGSAQLLQYEVPKPSARQRERQGFEWFGKFPPHPGLSAYGLLQFTALSQVTNVDPVIIERTRAYLSSLEKPDGDFRGDTTGHGFAETAPAVRNAFILWALSEAEKPAGDLHTTAYRRALQDLNQDADSYCLALIANTALNRSDADSRRLLRQLSSLQQADGALPAPATTITNSRGPEAIAETVALATAAWLQGGPEFMAEAQRGLQYLLRRRLAQGTFGTTQATVLTLRALALAPATPAALPASVAIQVGAETRIVPIVSDGPTTTTFTITDD